MVVRIRLTRFGRKNKPYYRIIAVDSRKPRETRYLEKLGTYDPLQGRDGSKEVRLKTDRIKYWLAVGAQPSETVERLLGIAGILPMPPIRFRTISHIPKQIRREQQAGFHTQCGAAGTAHCQPWSGSGSYSGLATRVQTAAGAGAGAGAGSCAAASSSAGSIDGEALVRAAALCPRLAFSSMFTPRAAQVHSSSTMHRHGPAL